MSTTDSQLAPLPPLALSGKRKFFAPRLDRSTRRWSSWLFAVPALVAYCVFVVYPVILSLQYSLYDWDGIGAAQFIGLGNYIQVFTDPELLEPLAHALILIIFFSLIPTAIGLVVAAVMREIKGKVFGGVARTLLFLPQIIPGAAAAVAWTWMYSQGGLVNQFLGWVGLAGLQTAWLGSFTWALPAVGIIGTWLNTGLCTLLLQAGIGKIDPSIYEAARMDGANRVQEFFSVTLPGLRAELGVCITITIIGALASFDVVFLATQGGPGTSTIVPGVAIYNLTFVDNKLGLSSALAIVLALLVLAIVGPLQRVFRER